MSSLAQAPADTRVAVKRVIHTIHAANDIAACRLLYLDMLGGLIFAEGYFEPEDRDMALLYVADHMVEPMSPRNPADVAKSFARYVSRYGQGFHSFEIKIENGPAVSAQLKQAGCKLASDYGIFFFVRQESTGGVLLEVCETPMPNDPYDRRNWRPDWSEGHPTTLVGLEYIACITPELDKALGFFTGLLDGELISDERVVMPQPGRRALVRLAETEVSFTQPDNLEGGALGSFLKPPTSGIYALVWGVEDEAKAEKFFQEKGLRTTRENCVSSGFAVDPRDFLGARHEFVQAGQ